ncbi:MAG: helix-turn-helix domain-containing protein, partial [Nitrospinaceae bacterium]|nr:helix-turn-helix transcriptional regulator [Nitrospinaceae bacterium]NIS88334.1 helix-turn-helix transcriptional regulator [Nitrospinaceae bacterium]NIT85212.1 helix-turn-helix transcriptional regulator [Nitrospinaceae bacterium]NIU47362.1 helix-turn-helix transcriptional regulator [Nitrospinaceae bacterium]NIU99582.1 helix-turn-helix domain-containing protein [Nitrospinaceae bacterium]
PNEFLNRTRMNYARRLLATTAKPVRDIAEESGYSDQLYFSRRFRHYHGVSPSQ